MHTFNVVLLLWESVKRHNKRRHIQKGLVTHHTGKSHRNMHTLKQSTTECDQQGLTGNDRITEWKKGD